VTEVGALAAAGWAWSARVDTRYGGKWAWLARRGRCMANRPKWQAGRNGVRQLRKVYNTIVY